MYEHGFIAVTFHFVNPTLKTSVRMGYIHIRPEFWQIHRVQSDGKRFFLPNVLIFGALDLRSEKVPCYKVKDDWSQILEFEHTLLLPSSQKGRGGGIARIFGYLICEFNSLWCLGIYCWSDTSDNNFVSKMLACAYLQASTDYDFLSFNLSIKIWFQLVT